jgi:rubrerythrin
MEDTQYNCPDDAPIMEPKTEKKRRNADVGKLVACRVCNHEWYTVSTYLSIVCPCCGSRNRNPHSTYLKQNSS